MHICMGSVGKLGFFPGIFQSKLGDISPKMRNTGCMEVNVVLSSTAAISPGIFWLRIQVLEAKVVNK